MMENALKGAGKLVNTIGYRAQLLVMGVLLPGILITLELGAIWALNDDARRRSIYGWVTQGLQSIAVPGIVLLLMALVTSYIVGYIARDLTFTLSNAWLRQGWRPNRSAAEILKQLRIVHGARQVDPVIARYRVFELAERGIVTEALTLPRPDDFYIREFCKLWLRTRAPSMATDGMEAEINMVIGFVLPVLLGIIPCLVFLPALFGTTTAQLAAFGCAVIGFRLFYNINAVRCQETEEAIGNFLFAHWMRLDAPPRPGAAPGLTGGPAAPSA